MKEILLSLSLCSCFIAADGQTTKSRLIAATANNYNGSAFYLVDSVNYSYFYPNVGGDLSSKYIPYYDAVTYRLDTGLKAVVKVKKSMQLFDSKYHRTTTTNYLWSGLWYESDQTLYTPDANDSVWSSINQNWNAGKMSWENKTREEYTYNVWGSRTLYRLSFWDMGTGSWRNSEQFLYDYNAANDLIRTTYQKWNTTTTSWENSFVDSFDYNPGKKVISDVARIWDKTLAQWKNFKYTSYEYDASNFLVVETAHGWDASASAWVNGQRKTDINDAKGNLVDQTTQNWNTSASTWDNFAKHLVVYDSRENITEDRSQIWDKDSVNFMNRQMYRNTFDVNNNLITQIAMVWSISDAEWTNDELDSFGYNHFNQLTYSTYFTKWNDAVKNWLHNVEDQEFRYYYEEYSTGIPESDMTAANLLLYPVPVRTTLNIKLNSIDRQSMMCRIIDMQGRVQLQWQVPPGQSMYTDTIPVNTLAPGHYVLELIGSKDGLISKPFSVN